MLFLAEQALDGELEATEDDYIETAGDIDSDMRTYWDFLDSLGVDYMETETLDKITDSLVSAQLMLETILGEISANIKAR